MRGDFRFVCTGGDTHKARELYRMSWRPDDLTVWNAAGDPQWSEMEGERERNRRRLVSTRNCDVQENEGTIAYRFRCPSCRPKQVFLWHADLEQLWRAARHANEWEADISRR